MQKQWWLYVLKLEEGKWYVGITSQSPEKRMQEHVDGVRAAYWTQRYKPLELTASEDLGVISKDDAEKRENKLVRNLMREYGYNNVRGGDLTSVEDYSVVFGTVMDRFGWETILVVVFLLLVALFLATSLYIQ